MKNNEQTKILLKKALSMSDDFSLSEVRFHIRSALSKIEKLEKKKDKREAVIEKRKTFQAKYQINPVDALSAIDNMIEEEKAKLEEFHRRKNKTEENDDLEFLGE